MKSLSFSVLTLLVLVTAPIHAGQSDANVTLLKVEKVTITDEAITIVVAEAKTTITLIRDDYDPAFTGDTWNGMPVTRVQVISNKATFTIKKRSDGALREAWQESLKTAKDLLDGKEVGRIGFFSAPDITIKGNMIVSITGTGHLYPKGK